MAKKWIQKARERMEKKGTVGAFRKYANRLGYDQVTPEVIEKAKKSKNPTLRKRAIFAENMRKLRQKRKR